MSDPNIQKRLREIAQANAMQNQGGSAKSFFKNVHKGIKDTKALSALALLSGNPHVALATNALGYGSHNEVQHTPSFYKNHPNYKPHSAPHRMVGVGLTTGGARNKISQECYTPYQEFVHKHFNEIKVGLEILYPSSSKSEIQRETMKLIAEEWRIQKEEKPRTASGRQPRQPPKMSKATLEEGGCSSHRGGALVGARLTAAKRPLTPYQEFIKNNYHAMRARVDHQYPNESKKVQNQITFQNLGSEWSSP